MVPTFIFILAYLRWFVYKVKLHGRPDWLRAADKGKRKVGTLCKVAFEKYLLRKIRRGESEPFYERFLLEKLSIRKIKEVA